MPFSVSAFSIMPFVQRIVYLSFILRSKQYSAGRGLAVFSGGSESEVWVLYSMRVYGFDEDIWFLMCGFVEMEKLYYLSTPINLSCRQ